ncbi:hypothetical protein CcaverHIS002_0100300 [Cutaneotrichosporon cavernicola]|uniref:SUI1 domain-containing protein n=1 Tax=Cutaneotrichosporon cavernicola TaxID=279322 RepID=A0AA48I3R3_9TREE|nr:uncharacterized protein CcaverHIS019_0100280 [Cutaneotrichosporon cavernicola]BEI79501.1 hypothetical protein CcaverHIS002_0100300 [Cutaneotrichosporon cavernicola]BEI87310.1 hypothetical protein CcaverHIS019_0100280 [Cutaneotrichosporon cavernicola]BEI95080.1 hypothetical protein CcaverHIS631_0100290 [Cutaneotrichosporon cavernicola]BEJ02854.1 hypothetical protein CcaverHIS641_0100290 [Cutaneotrichosporon cavernicola]
MSTTTKVDSSKTKSKASASAGATNLTGPYDPFASGDPFAEETTVKTVVPVKTEKIHIRLQQRNGRKTITTVQGIPDKYNFSKLLKAMKKEFACNGHVVHSADSDDEDSPVPPKKDGHGNVLQFQGDQRTNVKSFIISQGLLSEKEAKDQIVIHGY